MKTILKFLVFAYASVFSSAAFSNTTVQNFHANNCEFLVNGVGQVYQYNQGWYRRTLHAELLVSDESIQKLSMWVKYRNSNTGTIHEAISESSNQPLLLLPASSSAKIVEFAFEGSGNSSSESLGFSYEVLSFAFFGERDNGETSTRLWISDNGKNFSFQSTFTEPTYTNSIGRGSVKWANQSTPVFHQKHACASTARFSENIMPVQNVSSAPSGLKLALSQNGMEENFVLKDYTFFLGDNFVIPTSSHEAKDLIELVAAKATEICTKRSKSKTFCEKLRSSILTSRIDVQNGSNATSIFSGWIYSLDDNNWFKPNQLMPAIEPYFNSDNRVLFFFKDGNPEHSLVDPLSTTGIPVTLDPKDNSITIWTIQLND